VTAPAFPGGALRRSSTRRLEEPDEAGMTLVELLVTLVILVIVIGGLATLFVSSIHSETDQTNRVQAQQDARVALDQLRREIHCASAVTSVSSTALTVTLPSYCSSAPSGGGSVSWCVSGAAAPYTLKRYVASSCSGANVRTWANSLSSNAVFSYNRTILVSAPTLTVAATGGTLTSGTYYYDVTAVLSTGVEISGTAASKIISSGSTNAVTVSWVAPTGLPAGVSVSSYNVYGRDNGSNSAQGLRLLGNTTATSLVDNGSINTSTVTSGPPLATVSVSLATDKTPTSTSQQFSFSDDIVLRNSGRF
jgi:prepilin-type N-terminal cleavage/methylation domain-containing protein